MEVSTKAKSEPKSKSSENGVQTVLLTVVAQYAIIVFCDRVCSTSSVAPHVPNLSLLYRPLVHGIGCLISWIFLRSNENPHNLSLGSWLLTIAIGVLPFAVHDVVDAIDWCAWQYHKSVCQLRLPVAVEFAFLMIAAALALWRTRLPRYIVFVCIALLEWLVRTQTVSFNGAAFWIVCASMCFLSVLLAGANRKNAFFYRGCAYWMGIVGFGAFWLRELFEWLFGGVHRYQTDTHERLIWTGIYAVSHGWCLFFGLRNQWHFWATLGFSGLLLTLDLLLHQLFAQSFTAPLVVAVICIASSRWKK